MDTHQIINVFDDSYTTVKVSFDTSDEDKTYTYKVKKDTAKGIVVGDFLLVPARTASITKAKIVVVIEIDDEPDIDWNSSINYRWIIGKVETDEYQSCLETDKTMEKDLLKKQRLAMRQQLRVNLLEEDKNNENS